eukprot:5475096-Pyramimonas_sp.AAC.1
MLGSSTIEHEEDGGLVVRSWRLGVGVGVGGWTRAWEVDEACVNKEEEGQRRSRADLAGKPAPEGRVDALRLA